MVNRAQFTIIFAIMLLVGARANGGDVRGSWKLVSWTIDGKENGEDVGSIMKFDKAYMVMTLGDGEKSPKIKYRIDESKTPMEIDFVLIGEGGRVDGASKGLFDLKDDVLTLSFGLGRFPEFCLFGSTNVSRPKDFRSTDPGKKNERLIARLVRVKKSK